MLSPDQQKDLETAIMQYLNDKGYARASKGLLEDSKALQDFQDQRQGEINLLERKWFTILKLQQQIFALEKKLQIAEEIIQKSVRTLASGDEAQGRQLTNPIIKFVREFRNHKDAVSAVAVHQTEPYFASASLDCTIRVYDYELFE